jgi:hypothetical protein
MVMESNCLLPQKPIPLDTAFECLYITSFNDILDFFFFLFLVRVSLVYLIST